MLGLTDVCCYLKCRHTGGTIEHTLCKSYKRTYVGPPDVCYFLEYPLGKARTYKTPFGPLCKNYRTYARVARRPLV
jgi:hypothetical protein